jgi:hypothetical protein
VTPKKGHIGVEIALPAHRGKRAKAELVHAEYPGWLFRFIFDEDGAVARFEIQRGWPRPVRPENAHIAAAWRDATDEPLTARRLHVLPYGALLNAARSESAAWHAKLAVATPDIASRAIAAQLAKRFSERPGARGRDHLDYAELAAKYVNALTTPNPIETLHRELPLGKKRIQNLLTAARDCGVLTRPRPGRAEGELTDYGIELLEQTEHGRELLKEAGYGTH